MKRILLLLMLIGVVLASGCLGTQPKEIPVGMNGLIIPDFSPDANKIMAGDTVNLYLEVQNVGGAKASDINVSLYGVTFAEPPGEYDWQVAQGKLSFRFSEEGISQLLPPEEGIPGEIATYFWTFKAPTGIKADTTYSFDVRVEYNYLTDVSGILTFVSKDYWNRLSKSEKEALSTKAGVTQLRQTGGPIAVKLYAGVRERPFVIDPAQINYTIRVDINNVGSGEPKDVIKLISEKSSTGITISCPDEVKTKGIRLSAGKTASFSCTLTLGKTDILNKQDFSIALGFNYDWRVDSSTGITVKKPLT
ncbi:MAG: hypothetical protein QMD36_02200 [Candidatus Aenigmarchaeota archaeon]|nr:hypothetical protein [Candidatus Aenigmarchaeota archaeon]